MIVSAGTLASTGHDPRAFRRMPFNGNASDSVPSVHVGDRADHLLGDPTFASAWNDLWIRCPWATGFQTLAFAHTWYRAYREHYEPILIVQWGRDGGLAGLLALARSRTDGRLVVAGTNQAEYQTWLGTQDSGDWFGRAALRALDDVFPPLRLTFKYLPPGTPLRGVLADRRLGSRCQLDPHVRPLMRIDRRSLEASLKKSGTRSRVNRLERLGHLALERIVEREALEAVVDEIARQYDFRRGARSGVSPFSADPCKRHFQLALLDEPGLLHVTVLRAGDTVVAAHVGVQGSRMVHLGVFSHSPFFAEHSPGKLHLLMLGLRLAEEGIDTLDLTPGDDPYKGRFANAADEVSLLTVFGAAAERTRHRARDTCARSLKRAASLFGITPAMLRGAFGEVRRTAFRGVAERALGLVTDGRQARIFRAELVRPAPSAQGGPRRDALDDLLCFEPVRRGESRQAFLADALERLERGQRVYTNVEDGRLLHCGWLIERPPPPLPAATRQASDCPQDGSVLCDFYRHPAARARELDRQCIARALRDAAASADARFLYVVVRPGAADLDQVAREIGFRPVDPLASG